MTMLLMFHEDKAQTLVEQYTLTEEQLRYTNSPKDSIEQLFTNDFFGYSFISLVIVKPSERRKGVASALMKAYMQMAKTSKVFSSTNQSNKRMQQLFHNLGFVKSGVIDNLDEGDPEIIYMKQASPQA